MANTAAIKTSQKNSAIDVLQAFKRERLAAYDYYRSAQSETQFKKKQNDFALAHQHISQALALHMDANCLNLLSRIELERGNVQEAHHAINKALLLEPENGGLLYSLGHCQMAQKRYNDAVVSFESAIKHAPKQTLAEVSYPFALVEAGRPVEAFQRFRELVKTHSKDPSIRSGLLKCAKNIRADYYDPELEQDLLTYLKWEDANTHNLASLVTSLLSHKFYIDENGTGASFHDLAQCELFSWALKKSLLKSASLEKLILAMRLEVLNHSTQQGLINKDCLSLVESIAHYGLTTEYILPCSDAEENMVESLKTLIEESIDKTGCTPIDISGALLLFAMYRSWLSLHNIERLLNIDTWPDELLSLYQRVYELYQLKKIEFKNITPMPTENDVKKQYEAFPYPQWQSLDEQIKTSYGKALSFVYPGIEIPERYFSDALNVLIAGCGTGRHAINVAKHFTNTQVKAIDISQSSLAYAYKQAQHYHVDNIEFYLADLLKLDLETAQFDIVECSGVLHHIRDYKTALSNLTKHLKPGGFIKIALYSEQARLSVHELRERLTKNIEQIDENQIRVIRQALLAKESDNTFKNITDSDDFYSMSGVVDLLFHQYERQFSLLDIKQLCDEYDLTWMGFSNLDSDTMRRFEQFYGGFGKVNSLQDWHEFEQEYPQTFSSMYQFYCQFTPKFK